MINGENYALSSLEEIELHMLSVRDYWSSQAGAAVDFSLTEPERAKRASLQGRSNPEGRPKRRRLKPSSLTAELPETWNLIGGMQLFAWQEDCMAKWFNRNGTVKVVTGAGKTVLALAIMERLHVINPELRVAIVVPTIVLMDQWFDEITNGSNLLGHAVGRMGGGHKQGFSKDTQILICVLKSAADKLAANVDESGVGENLLLIVDECHRAGSKEMSKVFRTRRAYNLGLSATPEREVYDDGEDDPLLDIGYDTSMLGKELGPIIYEMTLAEADGMGLLPESEVRHYGLPLLLEEREQYEKLSAEINKLQDELRDLHDTGGGSFFAVCQKLAQQEGPLAARAMRFIKLTSDRKRLLYGATHRSAAALKLAEQALMAKRESRVIIFHESIDDDKGDGSSCFQELRHAIVALR